MKKVVIILLLKISIRNYSQLSGVVKFILKILIITKNVLITAKTLISILTLMLCRDIRTIYKRVIRYY